MGTMAEDGNGGSPTPPKPFEKVLIVGAGPAGLLLAILLARHGIPSTVLESWDRVDERLRATQYGVPATRVFRRAGILDDIRAEGIAHFPAICWRSVRSGEIVAGIDLSVVSQDPDRMTILPLNQILQIMLRHCREKYAEYVTLLFSHKVVGIQQDSESAWAEVQVDGAKEVLCFRADYVVGCDGGQSSVRKILFGRNWPGETFESRLLVQNVYYKGFEHHGWEGGNYMIDPEFWGLVAKRGEARDADGPLWRVTYGDSAAASASLSEDDQLKRRELAFKKMLPGHPDPDQYKVTQTSQFRMHNRCVDSMRVGRVFLAGDAAHVCNPFGGYGCMAAVLDVSGLADCLVGYHTGKAHESILDAYAQIRRDKFLNLIDRRSRKNLHRISKTDPDTALQSDPFLALLKGIEGHAQEIRRFLLKASSIEFDFTTLYSSK